VLELPQCPSKYPGRGKERALFYGNEEDTACVFRTILIHVRTLNKRIRATQNTE